MIPEFGFCFLVARCSQSCYNEATERERRVGLSPDKNEMRYHSALSQIERLIITSFAITLVMLIALYGLYSGSAFRELAARRQDDLAHFTEKISAYLQQKDKSVREVVTELASDTMLEADNQMVSLIAKQKLSSKLNALVQQEEKSAYWIVYKNPMKLFAYSGVFTMQDRSSISEYVRGAEMPITSSNRETHWELYTADSETYLFLSYRVYGYTAAIFCGAADLLDSSELLRDSQICGVVYAIGDTVIRKDWKEDSPAFSQIASYQEGEFTSNSWKYVIQRGTVPETDISVYQVLGWGDGFVLSDIFPLPLAVVSVFAASVVVLLLILRRKMRKEITRPMTTFMDAMREIQEGNEKHRIDPLPENREFYELSSRFNEMADEIFRLRIERYEQQLRQLQSQIKTHFYLNAFTTIQGMTYQKRDEDIRKFVTYLSQYMRYMMQLNQTMVMLQSEVKHIENYFAMQQLRFPGSVQLRTHIEKGTEKWQVPFLVIYTVAENTLKHAMFPNATLCVDLIVSRADPCDLRVRIEDNGPGFSTEALERLSTDGKQGKHIGLKNIRSTLSLLYGRQDLLRTGNRASTGGAWVEMTIPASTMRTIEAE